MKLKKSQHWPTTTRIDVDRSSNCNERCRILGPTKIRENLQQLIFKGGKKNIKNREWPTI